MAILLALVLLHPAACADPAAPSFTYERSVTDDATPAPRIDMAITTDDAANCFTVVEQLPGSLTPSAITGDGLWDASKREIRWGPYTTGTTTLTLSYRVTGTAGPYSVSGVASINGQWHSEPGWLAVNVASPTTSGSTTPPRQVKRPVISPPGSGSLPAEVTLACATDAAEIRYTLDGSLPTASSSLYAAPLEITTPTQLRSRAFKPGMTPSKASAAWFGVAFEVPAAGFVGTFDATHPAAPVVTLTSTPPAGSRCWTLSEHLPPGITATAITEGGTFDANTRQIQWGPFTGDSALAVSYTLHGPPGNATVFASWSIDGYGGTETTPRSVPIVVSETIPPLTPPTQVAGPVINPSGSSSLPATVTITCSTDGAEIRYTLDGSVPTASSLLYQGPVDLTSDMVLRARAFKAGMLASAATPARFAVSTPPPVLGLVRSITGNGSATPLVRITATPPADSGCFSITEILPAGLNPYQLGPDVQWNPAARTLKWGPFSGASQQVLEYSASGPTGSYLLGGTGSLDGWTAQTTGEDTLIVDLSTMQRVATPAFAPAANGVFPVTVTISCATADAEIRYTLDGSLPTETSPLYQGPLHLATITTLNARAFKPWCQASQIARVYYGEELPPPGDSVVRVITGSGTASPEVALAVTASSAVACQAVTETLPAGLIPSGINEHGHFNSNSRTIKWGPFSDNHARLLTYTLTGTAGTFTLGGTGGFNGFGATTTGNSDLVIVNPAFVRHEASGDWSYTTEVRLIVSPSSYQGGGTGGSGASVFCHSIEELLPVGVTPSAISDDGLWNPVTRTIKWGPYLDSQVRTVHYRPNGTHLTYEPSCRISIDGVSVLLTGDIPVTLGLPPPAPLTAVAGDGAIYLFWSPVGHEAGFKVFCGINPDGSDETSTDIGSSPFGFRVINNLVNGTTYRISMSAYDLSGIESERSLTVTATPLDTSGNWGIIALDSDVYDTVNDSAVVSVYDPDLNTNPATAQTVIVQVSSETDALGISLVLTETGPNTGVFTSTATGLDLAFTFAASDESNARLRVREGDVLSATYIDALPAGTRTANASFALYDSDHDGLPDWWERENFGNLAAANGLTDSDHDGVNDLTEWVTGTSPMNPSSHQRMTVDPRPGEGVIVRWNSVPGRRYTLRKSIGCLDGFFDLATDLPAAPGGTNEYRDIMQPGATSVFYSLRVELEP
ncbi:MAG: chitobiase/beta-hexosaminidase C-terminal domain-containing protein [Verrucomicrobiota bacterium]